MSVSDPTPDSGEDGEDAPFCLVELINRFERVSAPLRDVKGQGGEGVEIDAARFLDAYREVARIFDLLGPGFGFVKADVVNKVGILENILSEGRVGGVPLIPATLESLVRTELAHGERRGSRTLLRLRWALEFLSRFLHTMQDTSVSMRCGATSAYKDTLAHHHPWAIRQLVKVAFLGLTSREKFARSLCVCRFKHPEPLCACTSGHHEPGTCALHITRLLHSMDPVLQQLLRFYEAHELENLP